MQIINQYIDSEGKFVYHVDIDGIHGDTLKFNSQKTFEEIEQFATERFANYQFIKSVIEDTKGE